jgi:hypothetical protein
VLVGLKVGDVVPPQVYICDYEDGRIPAWQVLHIVEHEGCRRLTLIDPESAHITLWERSYVALDVVAFPTKVLATSLYISTGEPEPRYTNMLGDIRQRGRQINDLWEFSDAQEDMLPGHLDGQPETD